MFFQSPISTRLSTLTAALTVGLVAIAAIIRIPALGAATEADLTLLQAIALPLFVAVLFKWEIFGVRIPRGLLIASATCAVLALVYSYSAPAEGGNFLVARLVGDEFEADTRVFRDKLNHALREEQGRHGPRGVRFHASIKDHSSAASYFAQDAGPLAVVWGSKRWINVTFNPSMSMSFDAEVMEAWKSLTGLSLVTKVPAIGLSFNPDGDTTLFLARLLAGVSDAGFSGGEGSDLVSDPSRLDRVLSDLQAAGAMRAGWTLFAHRAFPYWVMGNLHLARALANGGYEQGELRCAIDFYSRARLLLRYGDNPELLAAILNNRGFAHFVLGSKEGQPALRKLALKEFLVAARLGRIRNPYGFKYAATGVARKNFEVVRHRQKKKHVRRGAR